MTDTPALADAQRAAIDDLHLKVAQAFYSATSVAALAQEVVGREGPGVVGLLNAAASTLQAVADILGAMLTQAAQPPGGYGETRG